MNLKSNLFEQTRTYGLFFNWFAMVSFLVISILSCTPNKQNSEALEGKWLLEAAERGGRPTSTLKDAYFNFIGDSLLQTNLLQEDGEFSYTYSGKTIQQDGATSITYNILHFQNDTLVLNAKIKNYDFTFLLLRDTTEVHLVQ